VDGSNVLFSLNGQEAEAVDWYHNKQFRSNYNYALSGGYVERYVGINFGRWLWDPAFALDPSKFDNLQLKVSMDIDAGGLSPTYNKLGVLAAMFDEKSVAPVGFLMHKELKSYTTAAGHEYTELPLDYAFRKLFLRCQYPGTEPNQIISNIKLSSDHDKKIYVDHDNGDIMRTIGALSPEVEESYWFASATSARYLCVAPSTRVTAMSAEWAAAAGGHITSLYDGDGGKLAVITNTVGDNLQINVRGFLPHATWEIPFGDEWDPEDWLSPEGISSLKLDITAGTASRTCDIFAQQARMY
jgi:hypothetical protein